MSIADRKKCARSNPLSYPDLPRLPGRGAAALGWILGVTLLGACTSAEEETPPPAVAISAEELAASANAGLEPEPWWQPEPIRSHDRVLRATLEVDYADHVVRDHTGARRELRLRSYNGQLVGPTLEFRAGDTLFVTLDNQLPPNPGTPADPEAAAAAHHAAMSECPNRPHDFNTTNLHTHGLHISPKKPADDVLLSVEPKERFDYVFPILPAGNPPGQPPGTHYPGTFWYHAHRHGSTAMQLASGMAGALILRGDVDEVPEIQSAGERLFLLQQIAYGKDGTIEDFDELRSNWEKVVEERTRINGRLYPLIELRPGQIERWRMIDSGVFADLPLTIVPENPEYPPFHLFQIAADGITFDRPRPVPRIELAPGNRADLLVVTPPRTPPPGRYFRYFLYKERSKYDLTALGMDDPSPAGPERVAEIRVRGELCPRNEPGCGSGIPRTLPAPTEMLPPIREVDDHKEVTFSVVPRGRGQTPKFLIEDDCYKPGRILPKFELKRGTAEQWTVVNTSGGPHPFHIHVNAFQLMDEGGVWRDTVLLPPNSRTRIRTRFERFDGTFVTHCHILTHEDLGMMQEVRINP